MKIACIKKDICVNIIECETLELARNITANMYDLVVECPNDGDIGHSFINDEWVKLPKIQIGMFCPRCNSLVAENLIICPTCGKNLGDLT